MLFHLRVEHTFRHCPNLFVNHLAIFHKQDGWDVADTVHHRDLRVKVYVYFSDLNFTLVVFGEFFNYRTYDTARTAPFCPEIDHAEFRAVKHCLLEICIGKF